MVQINIDEIEEYIVKLVTSRNGIKGTDLSVKLAGQFFHYQLERDTIIGMLQTLVDEKKLVEVEYIMPNSKQPLSFYLPKDSQVRI